jgi:hypothetical protein
MSTYSTQVGTDQVHCARRRQLLLRREYPKTAKHKIKECRPDNSQTGREYASGDYCGDRVRGIMKTIDVIENEGERD